MTAPLHARQSGSTADKPPLLSIVTVCFNSSATVAETLRSVDAALSSAPVGEVEHLIVDGLSTDLTLDIVDAHSAPFRRVVSQQDAGIYDAMNKGLKLARGRYAWFLNSDDLLDPRAASWMSELLDRLRSDASDVLIGGIKMFRDVAGTRRVTRTWRLPRNLGRARRLGWHPPHPGFIAKRLLLEQMGGFDERKRIAADYKLMIAAVDRAPDKVERFGHNLTMMREGGASNGSLRAIVRANIECYATHRELGRGRLRAGLGIAMKLSRKLAQKIDISSEKVKA
jgi:glycosyltransferase